MLRIGSSMQIVDNSGATEVCLINMRIKKTLRRGFIQVGAVGYGVVKKERIFFTKKRKTLKKKMMVHVLIAAQRKKYSRDNGFFLQFDSNIGIPFEFKNKQYQTFASRVKIPVVKEVKQKSIYKPIVLRARQAL